MRVSKNYNYGGQALIEGVMMRGPKKMAIAVRKPNQEIMIEKKEITSITDKIPFLKWPFFRGTIVLIESMIIGMKALAFSAEHALDEEEGEEISPWEMAVTIAIAMGLGVLLFVVLPTFLAKLTETFVSSLVVQNMFEGIIRIGVFLLYVLAISRMKDIQRTFEYHGAEHKTIHAYEAGEALTVENVQKHSSCHPRCGTSFLFIVMVVSILIFSFLGGEGLVYRIVSRVLLLPVVAGVSYEILKVMGARPDAKWLQWIITPGLWLQRLTTREPDAEQIEVAIASLEAVLEEEPPLQEQAFTYSEI